MTAVSLPRPVGRQREVLYLPADGCTVVLGTAGSGKTTLAILRSLHLADPKTDHGGRTLLVTFNRCLVTYMNHLAGTAQLPVDVRNYHHFARGYLGSRNKLPWGSISGRAERLRFIEAAVNTVRAAGIRRAMLDRTKEFFDEEFQWIQRHGVKTGQQYLEAERVGRSGARVARADRDLLFAVYSRYLERRSQAGKLYDWDDLADAVIRELQIDERKRWYWHVVIDEGQDFSPVMLRSLAAAVPTDGSLTFFGDIAQQIYGHRTSWRNAGLSAPRIWRFKENYRNTKQIAGLALALAEMRHFPADRDLVEPTAPAADGPLPVLKHVPNDEAARQFVVARATDLARTGTVAILLRTREQENAIVGDLPTEATRLHRQLNVWPNGPGLFYGTYHAAKGLEFDTVFMPFLSEDRWPHPPDIETLGGEEAAVRDSRLLYVGITRARSTPGVDVHGAADGAPADSAGVVSAMNGIRERMKRRGITRLCHLTPSRNLAHIVSDTRGILASRHLEGDETAIFNPTDKVRLDGYPDHVCCSIQYPNAWYFKKARAEEKLFRDWVVLLIDPRHLWQADTKFCPRNAAAGRGQWVRGGVAAFDGLFSDRMEGSGSRVYWRGPRHPHFLPTDEQAEVLISDRIGRSDVDGVVVRDDSQAAREESRLELAGVTVPRIVVVPEFFDPHVLSGILRSGRIPLEREYHRGNQHA